MLEAVHSEMSTLLCNRVDVTGWTPFFLCLPFYFPNKQARLLESWEMFHFNPPINIPQKDFHWKLNTIPLPSYMC